MRYGVSGHILLDLMAHDRQYGQGHHWPPFLYPAAEGTEYPFQQPGVWDASNQTGYLPNHERWMH